MTIGVTQFDRTNPVTPDDASTLPSAVNNCVGLLNGALSADSYGNNGTALELRIIDASAFPSAGWVSVGEEIISFTSRSGNTLMGIVRGAQSTTIRAHVSRSPAVLNLTALHFNALISAIIAVQTLFTKMKTENGSTDGGGTIALAATPITGPKVLLWINGVFYTETVDFTRVATVITFVISPPPPTGLSYTAFYWAQ